MRILIEEEFHGIITRDLSTPATRAFLGGTASYSTDPEKATQRKKESEKQEQDKWREEGGREKEQKGNEKKEG